MSTMPELEVCPVCGLVPDLGYCGSAYMVSCLDPYCPVGGNSYTERHSSEKMEIEAWNRRVKRWKEPGRVYCGGCDFHIYDGGAGHCHNEESPWAGATVRRDNYCSHAFPRIREE